MVISSPRTVGSLGRATNTVWMTPLADKLTMVNSFDNTTGLFNPTTAVMPLLFANKWLTSHTSFGSFTTAPDGTNTAVQITEDNTTNNHAIYGAIIPTDGLPVVRMGGIFKAGLNRTRVALVCGSAFGGGGGFYVGFDLAGGQIAYTAQGFGGATNLTVVGQAIQQVFPNWYLCTMDYFSLREFNHNSPVQIFIDSGSGTGAPNINYLGDGVSGILAWKTSTLPVDSWSINNTVFFDDFNDPTLANFDLAGTFPDGKDWYLQAYIPAFTGGTAIPPANVTASASILTINPVTIAPGTPAVCSYGNPGDGRAHGAVGRNVHAPPVYFELKQTLGSGWNNWVNDRGEISVTFCATTEFCDNLSQAAHISGPPPYPSIDGSKMNWSLGGWSPTLGDYGLLSTGVGLNLTIFTMMNQTGVISSSPSTGVYSVGLANIWGFAQWEANRGLNNAYNPNNVVFHIPDSIFYSANSGGLHNEPPGTGWSTFTYPTNSSVQNQPAVFTDMTKFHVYGYILVPYNRLTKQPGALVSFGDGVCASTVIWYPAPTFPFGPNDPLIFATDWQHLFFMLQTGQVTGSGYNSAFDYVKVMK